MEFDEYDTDRKAWLIDRGYDDHVSKTHPRSIPRVERSYRVDSDNDPNGRRGQYVRSESPRSYERRCTRFEDKDKRIWAKAIRGYTGAARTTAMQAPQYQAKPLFDKIQEAHGDKSDKQVTHIVREFVGRTKTSTVKITDFNQTWTEGVRVLKHNGMELPEKFIVNLYLISLGARYRTLEAVVSVLPSERRTLSHVMKLAVDHSASGNGDEAEHGDMALLSEIAERNGFSLSRKRTPDEAFAATGHGHRCEICGKPGHTKAECFAHGGGLAHLNYRERQNWLTNKRQRKWQENKPQQEQQQKPAPKATESAAMAQQQSKDQESLIAALEAKVADQQSKMEFAKAQVNGAIDIGY